MDIPPPENNVPPPGSPPFGNPPPGSSGRVCPNCRQPYEKDPQFCPHCGFNLDPIPHHKYVAGSSIVDGILAFLLCVLCAPMVVTMLVPLVLFFVMDKRYVGFRRGMLVGMILFGVLVLGALALCGVMIFSEMNSGRH